MQTSGKIARYVATVPKAELHVHLEGSIQPATLLTLAQRNGVQLPVQTVAELQRWFTFRDFNHFVEYLSRGIWPFLGTFLLAEAIDRAGAHLALHGHAHRGRERGQTPGGVPVRNVAQPVIDRACKVYRIDPAMPSAGLQPEDAVAAIGS